MEQVVEQLSNQLRSTIKSQIKQIQSGNGVGGESRLGMSKFSSLTELHAPSPTTNTRWPSGCSRMVPTLTRARRRR